MTRAKDISKILTDANISGTLDVTGTTTGTNITASGSISSTDGGTALTLGVLSNATTLPALNFNGAFASSAMTGLYGNGVTASNLYYTVPSSKEHIFSIADSQKMVLSSSGKLGLGTSSPDKLLHLKTSQSVACEIKIEAPRERGRLSFHSQTNSGTDYEMGQIEIDRSSGSSQTAHMIFATNGGSGNTERMRIDSGGRFLLGHTSNVAASGNARFQLVQGNANWIHYSDNNNGSGGVFNHYLRFSGQSPDDNTSTFLLCEDSTAARLKIFSDGDVDNHDNSYSGFSDNKLKEQIKDASSQWNDIKALTVRKFKFKTDVATGDSDAHWRLGVIAQEVETAGMSGLVKSNPDMETDESGNIELTGTTTKSVKYSILYMKAVKALQEAMTRIETLEAKVKTLEGA